jgi:hypothetical protein
MQLGPVPGEGGKGRAHDGDRRHAAETAGGQGEADAEDAGHDAGAQLPQRGAAGVRPLCPLPRWPRRRRSPDHAGRSRVADGRAADGRAGRLLMLRAGYRMRFVGSEWSFCIGSCHVRILRPD